MSPPVCNILFYFTLCLKQIIYSTLLEFIFSIYKVGSQTRLSIDVWVKQMSEAERTEAFFRVIFTTCISDNYLFHQNSVSKYLFQKYSSTHPGDWMVVSLVTDHWKQWHCITSIWITIICYYNKMKFDNMSCSAGVVWWDNPDKPWDDPGLGLWILGGWDTEAGVTCPCQDHLSVPGSVHRGHLVSVVIILLLKILHHPDPGELGPIIGPILVQRRRRWTSIGRIMVEYLALAENHVGPTQDQRLRHWFFAKQASGRCDFFSWRSQVFRFDTGRHLSMRVPHYRFIYERPNQDWCGLPHSVLAAPAAHGLVRAPR